MLALAQDGGICATHAEAGVVWWDVDQDAAPRRVLAPANLPGVATSAPALTAAMNKPAANSSASQIMNQGAAPAGPRNLQVLREDSLIFSVGPQLFECNGTDARVISTGIRSEVVAILPFDADSVAVVYADGSVCLLETRAPLKVRSTHRRGVPARAAGTLPWLGSARLLLATEGGPVQCLGLEDGLVTEYLSNHRGMRMIQGSTAAIAAVTTDRQRLVLWNSWDGREPSGEIYLTGITRHRVADIDFG